MILDGNGRWANARGLPRTAGHAAGEAALFDTVDGALEIGIGWLTAYTFSTENWDRDPEEVEFLMWFNEDLLTRRRNELHEKGVRMRFMGDLDDPRVPDRNRRHMAEAAQLTARNDRLNLVFAFNYGSRRESPTRHACWPRRPCWGSSIRSRSMSRPWPDTSTCPAMPDLDLVIRSSGEHRLSNFLLWQAAYAEFWFPGILWPDFNRHHLLDAVIDYQQRERRFGGAVDEVSSSPGDSGRS